MTEYTPSPAKVRNIYKDFGVGPTPARRMDEFDRMIREVQAEAWDEGHRACDRDWALTYDIHTPDEDRAPLVNPYRAKEQP